VFFLYIVAVLLRGILRSEEVDADTLYGAVTAYLLIGVTWAFFYAMVYLVVPNAFTFGPLTTFVEADPLFGDLRFFIYYSLVTLSTLGYGDITPLAPMARTLASLEAVLGQLYIAVAVAALVGTHIAQKQSS
jgi:amino acid transporter